jgi:hypothetical protein
MFKKNPIIWVLEWLGHYQTIQTIIQAHFVRTLLLPVVTAVATAVFGWIEHIPLMWVIMAVALAFMGAMQGVLSSSEYLERKNPAYKLQVTRPLFNFNLVEVSPPNRKQRLAAKAQGGAPAVPAHRHFEKGQLGFEIWNKASFPISIIVFVAETEIEGLKPPRAKFPKKATLVQPGTSIWIHDDAIDMQNMDCDNLDGSVDITIKYGLPGKERFEMKQKGTVEIFMESFGQYKGLYFHPAPNEPDSGVPTDARH